MSNNVIVPCKIKVYIVFGAREAFDSGISKVSHSIACVFIHAFNTIAILGQRPARIK